MKKKDIQNYYNNLYNGKLEDLENNLKKFIKSKEEFIRPKDFRER